MWLFGSVGGWETKAQPPSTKCCDWKFYECKCGPVGGVGPRLTSGIFHSGCSLYFSDKVSLYLELVGYADWLDPSVCSLTLKLQGCWHKPTRHNFFPSLSWVLEAELRSSCMYGKWYFTVGTVIQAHRVSIKYKFLKCDKLLMICALKIIVYHTSLYLKTSICLYKFSQICVQWYYIGGLKLSRVRIFTV